MISSQQAPSTFTPEQVRSLCAAYRRVIEASRRRLVVQAESEQDNNKERSPADR